MPKTYLNKISSGYRQIFNDIASIGYQVCVKDSAEGVTLEVIDFGCGLRVARIEFHPSFLAVFIGDRAPRQIQKSEWGPPALGELRRDLDAQRDLERLRDLGASSLAYYDGIPHDEAQDAR